MNVLIETANLIRPSSLPSSDERWTTQKWKKYFEQLQCETKRRHKQLRQSLWLSWSCGRFWNQRSTVLIQSSSNVIHYLMYWKDKMKKKRSGMAQFKQHWRAWVVGKQTKWESKREREEEKERGIERVCVCEGQRKREEIMKEGDFGCLVCGHRYHHHYQHHH